jgi:hypothetical protein
MPNRLKIPVIEKILIAIGIIILILLALRIFGVF